MNKWIGSGNLVRDPELRTSQNGTQICNFTVACNRRFKKEGQPTADFIQCIAFNKAAEFVANNFHKGKAIGVDGSIQTRSWTDREGNKRYATEIVADNVEFCGNKSGNTDSGSACYGASPTRDTDETGYEGMDLEDPEALPF